MRIAMLTKRIYNTFRYSFKVGCSYSSPSITAAGAAGILLLRMAALPFISSRESLEVAWLQHSLSSLPVCLATTCASLFTCCSAVLCQPPKDSKAIRMKDTPCLAQSYAAPLIFHQQNSYQGICYCGQALTNRYLRSLNPHCIGLSLHSLAKPLKKTPHPYTSCSTATHDINWKTQGRNGESLPLGDLVPCKNESLRYQH